MSLFTSSMTQYRRVLIYIHIYHFNVINTMADRHSWACSLFAFVMTATTAYTLDAKGNYWSCQSTRALRTKSGTHRDLHSQCTFRENEEAHLACIPPNCSQRSSEFGQRSFLNNVGLDAASRITSECVERREDVEGEIPGRAFRRMV